MRAFFLFAFSATLACATGPPVGARPWLADKYEPFSSPADGTHVPPSEAYESPVAAAPDARARVLRTARSLLGQTKITVQGRRYGDDCTGFVRAAYDDLGIDLMAAAAHGDNGVTGIWRFCARHGRIYTGGHPLPGDLVFFKETYDLNRDGHSNDGLTHIGLVEAEEPDGTVLIIHRVARGVVRYRMNLRVPNAPTDSRGRTVNDALRAATPGASPRLTSQLFAGFATLLPPQAGVAEESAARSGHLDN